MSRSPALVAWLLLGWLGGAGPASAADLYLAGNLLISSGNAEASGSTDFFEVSGEDGDSSPALGGALGLAFAMDEAAPEIWGVEMPGWTVRSELEILGGRDWELRTDGGDGFFSDVDSWSTLTNVWLEIPAHPMIAWAFGRIPTLEFLNVWAGGGMGLAMVDVVTTDNVSRGEDDGIHFAWQVGAGLGYEFTDWATFSIGYRYLDLGEAETELRLGPGASIGTHSLDLGAHELVSGLRIEFYSSPLAELIPERWSLPRFGRGR